ncbi:MAG: hypothetical protein ACLFOC_02850 [Campylobacterales bacterium]
MRYSKNKNGSILLYAIAILVLLATLGAYALQFASVNQRVSFDDFAKIQMELYARSAAEFGVLWMQYHKSRSDENTDQNKSVQITYDNLYDFNITIHPVDVPSSVPESDGTVVMDIVGVMDAQEIGYEGSDKIEGTTPYRYTKRIVVKP